MNELQLRIILESTAEISAALALIKVGKLKPYFNKSQAYSAFGRQRIENWLKEGKIMPIKDGDHSCVWRLDRIQLLLLSMSESFFLYSDSLESFP